MQDDIIGALTQEIKEEIIENYFYARRSIEEQIKHVHELAEHTAKLEDECCDCLSCIYKALTEPEFVDEFTHTLGLKNPPYEERPGRDADEHVNLRSIKVRGLTQRAKFRRLLLEAYRSLYTWTSQYRKAYENLQGECKAVNHNLKKFENDYDLLTLLRFLKDMDVDFIEKKHWLGDNFTPEEMASIESSLSLKPIHMEQFRLNPPLSLPEPKKIQRQLSALAECVYSRCTDRIKKLIQQGPAGDILL